MPHRHYTGTGTEFEILDEYKGKKGFFIKIFFINTKWNRMKWRVTWASILAEIQGVIGIPIVMQADMQHPDFITQDFFAKGYVVDYTVDEGKKEAFVIARIMDAFTIKAIKDKKIKYSSPAVVARTDDSMVVTGRGDTLLAWIAVHLALVAIPAYGEDAAYIKDVCDGTGDECVTKLRTAAQIEAWVAADAPATRPEERRLHMAVARLASTTRKAARGTPWFEHQGKRGQWIRKNDMDVFVAAGQKIDAACACKHKNTKPSKTP